MRGKYHHSTGFNLGGDFTAYFLEFLIGGMIMLIHDIGL